MASLFYRNVRLLILSLILIIVWGLSSYQALPRLEDPELVSRNAVVTTFLSGAKAERVEALVTEKIEDELTEIEEIDTYESTSRAGSSIIEIELAERLTADEVDGVWSRVRDKLDDAAVEFPAGTTDPELDEVEVKAYAMVAALTWDRDDVPNYAILRRRAEILQDRLNAIAGTESIDLFGDPDEEVVIEVNPSALVSLGLSPDALASQIRQSDSKDSAGQFRGGTRSLPIEVEGELTSLEQLRQLPIQFGDDGQFTYLGDMASIRKATVEPLQDMAIASGRPAIVLGAFVQSSYRLDQWAAQAHQVIQTTQAELSDGLSLNIIFDQSSYVSARLNKLILNLIFGGLLVFAVTLVMMGWQSAVIVGTALPLSLLMVLGLMGLMGIPLHQMSVTGLIVALGILIDTAIVMVDEVKHRLSRPSPEGDRPPDVAINQSIQHLAVPLLSSTITTVLAFVPIALLPGSVGEFVGTIGLNVILAVSCSLLLSLTVIPALAVHLHQIWRHSVAEALHERVGFLTHRLLGQSSNPRQSVWWEDGFSNSRLSDGYRQLVSWTTHHPVCGIVLALALPLFGMLQAPHLEQQFFPPADRDQIHIELELSAASSIAQTHAIATAMGDRLTQFPEIKSVDWFVGENAPRFYYNLTGGRENEANFAQAMIQLNTRSTPELVRQVQQEVNQSFPTVQAVVRQFEQGPPFDAPVEVRLYGNNIRELERIGDDARSHLVQIENVTHTRASLNDVLPQLTFTLNEEAVRRAGLDDGQIAQQMNLLLEGIQGGSILEDTEELPVRVRVSNSDRATLDQIASLPLVANPSAPGEWIPVSALGEVSLTPEPAKITHRNGQRVNTIQGFIQAGTLPNDVLIPFQQQLEASLLPLPPGYSLDFGGEAAERDSAVGNLVSLIGVLVVLTVATLVLSLGSFRLAGLIGSVAIASFGLGLFSVWLFGYPFGFNPIIGTVGLIGVAINDSIVVLAALDENPRARMGDRAAVRDVVMHSTRHVLTTTFTTMIGFVPLLLDGGGFWPPLAVAIAGGVGGATLLALFLIPSAYVLLKHRQWKMFNEIEQGDRTEGLVQAPLS
ncbi:MAG: efflux RND transporter permease subunit [Cyanobacteria bacterium P01_A01_bin.37]